MDLMHNLALGFGVAFFLDYLDRTIKTPDDIRLHVGAPLLAVIPQTPSGNGDRANLLLLKVNAQGRFVEGYRMLTSYRITVAVVALLPSMAPP